MRSKILGYIVVGPRGAYHAAAEYHAEDQSCILWLGDSCTLFSTRKSANAILERTKFYAKAHHYDWAWLEESYVRAVRN